MKFFLIGTLLSALHFVATCFSLFAAALARTSGRENTAVAYGTADAALRVLSFPVVSAASSLYPEVPDGVLFILAPLNSCVWGFGMTLLWICGIRLIRRPGVKRAGG